GNFTINHLSELAVRPDRVTVRYVLDLAEIPTYAVMREASASAKMSPPQLAAWANAEAKMLAPQLQLSIDGRPRTLTIDGARATTRPGAGGLPLLYLVVDTHAPLATGERVDRLTYTDATYHGRIGWKDAILAPQTEPTHELTAYPSALLGSPRQRTGLAAQTNAAGVLAVRETGAQSVDATAAGPAVGRSNQLSDMLAKGTGNPGFILLTLLVAIGLGALHALEPGHGKTLLAVSLVGARATVKQASILAGALTIAHTAGVIALGFAILLFKGLFVPEAIYPWITLISGIAVAVIGARAIARQVSLRVPFAHEHAHAHAGTHPHAHDHAHFGEPDHGHGHGAHAHGHGHGHEPAHTHDHDDESHARQHAIPGSAPLKFGATVWAAMSGGVAPCPAALVVLLAAVALGQVGYGLVV
ncbi:MAG: hypothetical protein ACREM8_13465, partial [Vulcanimicrobiaceae bacterium]